MAVEQILTSQLRLVLYDGVHPETGDPVYVRKNFNNIKPLATADELKTVAQAFASLQTRPLHQVERQNLSEIIE